MSQFGVVIVATTSAALKAEKLLRSAGIKEQLIPTPREYSSDCGLAVRFIWAQRDEVEQLLTEQQVDITGIFPLEDR